MIRPSLLCVALASSTLLFACSRLFDAERAQCKSTADCTALGGTALVCVDGLCERLRDGTDPAEEPDAAEDTGSDGAQTPQDGGSGVPPADCPAASAPLRFCDGFEDGFDPWTRELDEDTRLTIVSHAARGSKALKAETRARGDLWAEVRAPFSKVTDAPVWARAYVYLSSDERYKAFTFLRVESGGEGSEGLDVSVEGSSPRAVLFVEAAGTEGERQDDERFPLDRWVCVELAFALDTLITSTASLYIDGRLAATHTGVRMLAGLERVRAGMFFTAKEQTAAAVHIDAVAIGTERVGCR